ncbi:DUF998 domain-containing protein [Glycomyces sp. A-F 0318]|uniref:DUF998 domain-containing protein n=1 Tax=Glycomyces amatae TaxID=2881355 RepID=UPI001E51478D|nr:DUF998 domain-containing protein [Glycomyces amatae]MCD0442558.1 DUF998 domain-containing protein [Glycomyces amatae]
MRLSTRRLLLLGAAAGPLFLVASTVQSLLRADYDLVRHPISSLSIGGPGWVQDANFMVTGLLTVALALGARRVLAPGRGSLWGPVLLAAWGVGLIGAGAFESDPVSGFPPGTPEQITDYTAAGFLHDLFSMLGFACLMAAGLVLAVRFARTSWPWAVYTVLTVLGFGVLMGLASAAFGQSAAFVDYGGFYQRAALLVGFAWTTALALRLLRADTETS